MKTIHHLLTVAAALLLAAFSTRARADVFGYAASLGGELHYVNLTVGSYTVIGTLTPAAGSAVTPLTGQMQALAMAPGGELIGVDDANMLYLIDKATGVLLKATPLPITPPFGVTRPITGLDYDETRKVFVAIAGGVPGSGPMPATERWDLTIALPALTVNPLGSYTFLSTPPSGGMQSVAWLGAPDRLLMAADSALPASFLNGPLPSGPWTFTGAGGGDFRGLDRAADGMLYGIGIGHFLWQIDPATSLHTALVYPPMNEWTSLACEVPQCVEIIAYAGTPTPWRNTFAQPTAWSGMVTSVTGNIVGSHSGAFGPGPYIGHGHMMEVIAGPGAGLCSEVIESNGSQVFLADDLSAQLVAGSSVVAIRRYHTLATLFPGGAGLSPFDDLIIFKDPGGSTRNYFWDGTDWVNPVDLLGAGSVVVRPCQEICFLTMADRIVTLCGYPSACRCPAFPALYPADNCPCDGKWHLRTIRVRTAWLAATALNSISDAMNIALTAVAGSQFTITSSTSSVLNHTDPFTAKTNPPTTFCEKKTLPGVLGWKDTDKMVVQAETKIVISAAEAGLWTFGIRADDGFAFRLLTCPPTGPGVPMPWSAVSGAGNALDTGNSAVVHALPTVDSNCHAVINLPAGTYCAQFIWFERAGHAHFELYAGRGAFPTGADPWRLVGYRAQDTVNSCWPCMQNWIVTTSARGGPALGSINAAAAELAAFSYLPIAYPNINFIDPDAPGWSLFGANVPFPNDTAGTVDVHFGMRAFGVLIVPCTGDYVIGFRGDDGARLTLEACAPQPTVPPPSFTGPAATFTFPGIGGAPTFCPDRSLECNAPTGIGGVAGTFHLTGPTGGGGYPINVIYRQHTFGAALEVFTKPASWRYYNPRLLGADTCTLGSDRHGIALCRQNNQRIAYPVWAQTNAALLSDPAADPDHDGWENRAEFAAGSDALSALSIPQFQSGTALLDMDEPTGPSRFQTISIIRSAIAEASVTGLSSGDLNNFEEAIPLGTEDLGTGLLRETWRAPAPIGETSRSFLSTRLREYD